MANQILLSRFTILLWKIAILCAIPGSDADIRGEIQGNALEMAQIRYAGRDPKAFHPEIAEPAGKIDEKVFLGDLGVLGGE